MGKSTVKIMILALNMIGILCLVYYGIPYLLHDETVANPDAMLPMENWDAAGIALTIGIIPLITANILAYVFVGREKVKNPVRLLFFLPGVLCIAIAAHYWFASLAIPPEPLVQVKWVEQEDMQYGVFFDDGSWEALDADFSFDAGNVYIADNNCFVSKIQDGKIANRFVDTDL